jgi:hypothetical protein
MTVKRLTEILSEYPDDMPVAFFVPGGGPFYDNYLLVTTKKLADAGCDIDDVCVEDPNGVQHVVIR